MTAAHDAHGISERRARSVIGAIGARCATATGVRMTRRDGRGSTSLQPNACDLAGGGWSRCWNGKGSACTTRTGVDRIPRNDRRRASRVAGSEPWVCIRLFMNGQTVPSLIPNPVIMNTRPPSADGPRRATCRCSGAMPLTVDFVSLLLGVRQACAVALTSALCRLRMLGPLSSSRCAR